MDALPESSVLGHQVCELNSPVRLSTIAETDLLNAPSPTALQMLTELAAHYLSAPVALVTLVTDKRQFFAGSYGLVEPWNSRRETPLSHSFCQHVTMRNEPLVVRDARKHELLQSNGAIDDLQVVAYLGVPLTTSEGHVLGSLCVLDSKPREWTTEDLSALQRLVAPTMAEISAIRQMRQQQNRLLLQQQQVQKMEAIAALSGGIAHDFNNVLAVFQIQCGLLSRLVPNQPAIQTVLQQLDQAQVRAQQIVQRLITWDCKQSESNSVSLGEVIRNYLPRLRQLLPADIAWESDIPTTEIIVSIDPAHVIQILENLGRNAEFAMRDSEEKRIRIKLALLPHCQDLSGTNLDGAEIGHGTVCLEFSDTGCGIPEEIQNRVCEPYFTTKSGSEGSGMGLATVFRIVRAKQGSMNIECRGGTGTTIKLLLPATQSNHDASSETLSMDGQDNSNAHILFVDDDAAIVAGYETLLSHLGFRVTCTQSSLKALEILKDESNDIDLLITDQSMAELSGHELISEMRMFCPELPTILCTGFSRVVNRTNAAEFGIDAYCVKPVEIEELLMLINNLLARKATRAVA